MYLIYLLIIFGFITAFTFITCSSDKSLRSLTVKDVNIHRYLGVWYEIARFPHTFEKGLVGVTATYAMREDGKVDVKNEGFRLTLDGKKSTANAYAIIPDSNNKGWLKVYFVPFFGADYLILDLDKINYDYALVGSTSKNYLWILSRKPQLDQTIYESLINKAKALGFDTQKLELVEQRK